MNDQALLRGVLWAAVHQAEGIILEDLDVTKSIEIPAEGLAAFVDSLGMALPRGWTVQHGDGRRSHHILIWKDSHLCQDIVVPHDSAAKGWTCVRLVA